MYIKRRPTRLLKVSPCQTRSANLSIILPIMWKGWFRAASVLDRAACICGLFSCLALLLHHWNDSPLPHIRFSSWSIPQPLHTHLHLENPHMSLCFCGIWTWNSSHDEHLTTLNSSDILKTNTVKGFSYISYLAISL